MKKVYCKKDYEFFEKGKIYYSEEIHVKNGMTFSIMFIIYDLLNPNYKIGEIGYLYDEVFETVTDKRKRIIDNMLNEEM